MKSKEPLIRENIDKIKEWISEKLPLREIAKRLEIKQSTLVKNLNKCGIYYQGQQNWAKGKKLSKKTVFDYIGKDAKYIYSSKLRNLLIKDGVKENKCERCGRSEWEGGPIPLELHHIDKNRYNNCIENLKILCSNCHMQIHEYSNV